MTLPEWMAPVETVSFVTMVGVVLYNRLLTYRAIQAETRSLHNSFGQYQKDYQIFTNSLREMFKGYMETCERCRENVRNHHESDRHVTPEMREQIKQLAADMGELKLFLMDRGK